MSSSDPWSCGSRRRLGDGDRVDRRQWTDHGVPHTVACRALDVSESWFSKWKDRPPTAREQRRERLRAEIQGIFCGSERTYGSPRVHRELRDRGRVVTRRTVAELMAADGLAGRRKKRRRV